MPCANTHLMWIMKCNAMATVRKIAGVILVGGQSSRMGTNKALLNFHGRPLVEHMIDIVGQTGCSEVILSGSLPGYECLPDLQPHEGPAKAIQGLLERFRGRYDALLCVPVDLPLMTAEALRRLLSVQKSASFEGHPLPAVIDTGDVPADCRAVYQLLQSIGAVILEMPAGIEGAFINVNTKQEWETVTC